MVARPVRRPVLHSVGLVYHTLALTVVTVIAKGSSFTTRGTGADVPVRDIAFGVKHAVVFIVIIIIITTA